MTFTLTQSTEQKRTADFSAKFALSDYTLGTDFYCRVYFASYEKLLTSNVYKIIVEETICYHFGLYVYPNDDYSTVFGLGVEWHFDDDTSEYSYFWRSLTGETWTALENNFYAPHYEDKNVQYAIPFFTFIPPSTEEDVSGYIDDITFYPLIVDQTYLVEDGLYWISLMKGFQVINRTEGHRSVGYPGTASPLYGFDKRRGGTL